jgi:radical SAM protein with 4Fe4S-binding SPASM domain
LATAVACACGDVPCDPISDALVPRVINCCGMGEKTIAVKEDGTVVPCHLFFSSAGAGVGNILDEDIVEKLCRFASALPTVDDVEGCRECDMRYFCGNGCWAHVHAAHGSFERKNPYCGFYKRYFSSVVWNLGLDNAMERTYDELNAP